MNTYVVYISHAMRLSRNVFVMSMVAHSDSCVIPNTQLILLSYG